jgi:pilus assembly protein CpaF
VASAIDMVVHTHRLRDGTRRVTHVTEVVGMEGDVITLQDLMLFDYGMGVNEDGHYLGRLKATGIRPSFSDHLENMGVPLPAELFAPEPFAKR